MLTARVVFCEKSSGADGRYMIDQRVESAEALQGFDVEGYEFNAGLSSEDEWIFTRHPA